MQDEKKQTLLIIGAGAIGRGYLPWIFDENTRFIFVDQSNDLIQKMRDQKKYTTYRVRNNQYEALSVNCEAAYTITDPALKQYLKENKQAISAIFINVGPRAVRSVLHFIKEFPAPLILSENDPETAVLAKKVLGREDVFFAVPDVITSNTAPDHLKEKDALALVTEDGKMFIEAGLTTLAGDFETLPRAELLDKQWTAKLFLHNTPHCIAAYMGHIIGVKYVHEAMAHPEIDRIVVGAMQEMLASLKAKWEIPHQFLDWYANKELERFRQKLLFDPISRVAREPLRKLEPNGRLIGAAQICLSLGFVPYYVLLGIISALLFDDPNDNDSHMQFMQSAMSRKAFLTYVLGLRDTEALTLILDEQFNQLTAHLNTLRVSI